ncbi:MAG: UDP-N-acetylmuramate--L-alanine ligase [Deltaproteobacteria bacterium]|nr:UDP-N-acetylmuramate--L-alanine ligase [Myxococcales bacterium]MCZ6570719.1 UDP-N-acetylmuramate--L-alanine ligase [Deltaproteobacteria bacterium]MCZ6713372.1 UDP-N-acetylmuramate--L-alanine ligase [Deltaproteobacteria bacterium]MCZ6821497.1 UDP-N-acetylmuramate--L-alanine ligase [Deltaproteobacteria bacterium]TDI97525.1 MAG: UDP-N-acetylmuramate--L-alanine ligase [Deltaproteobacteria bacterium]
MIRRIQRVYFVGIGGIGMSGLAEILHASGYSVSGSDLRVSSATRRLGSLGIPVTIGHDAANVGRAHVLVYSSAVPATNPELQAAHEAHIPVIPRAEMLAELMRIRYSVAIAGSHGKTTTTSLVGAVLQTGGLDPTIIVGGLVKSLGTNSRLGSGDVLVAEADESDGSFLHLIPTLVVVTNIDREHIDHYQSFERLNEAFLQFANRVPFYGACVLCLDDPNVQALLPDITRRVRTYGLSAQAQISAEEVSVQGLETRFVAKQEGRKLGPIRLQMPGIHNARNALAAIAVGLEFDVAFTDIQRALEEFEGVERRFEIRGEREGVLVIDDYAHHPTEIRATLAAAREGLGRRIVAAFQPHRYTRTRDLFGEFAHAFHDSDVLLVTEIYAAGESKLHGVEARDLVEAIRGHGHREVHWVAEAGEVVSKLRQLVRAGDALIFMGAGDIGQLAARFLEENEGGCDD